MKKKYKLIATVASIGIVSASIVAPAYLIISNETTKKSFNEENNPPIPEDNETPTNKEYPYSYFFEWPTMDDLEKSIYFNKDVNDFIIDYNTFEYLFVKDVISVLKQDVTEITFDFYKGNEFFSSIIGDVKISFNDETFHYSKKYEINNV